MFVQLPRLESRSKHGGRRVKKRNQRACGLCFWCPPPDKSEELVFLEHVPKGIWTPATAGMGGAVGGAVHLGLSEHIGSLRGTRT